MSGNDLKEKSCREKFLENKRDLTVDVSIAGIIVSGVTAGAIIAESYIAGAGALLFGVIGAGKCVELYKANKQWKQDKKQALQM